MMRTAEITLDTSYEWTSRIIGFIWAFLSACFAILNTFIFVQPQWIGDTLSSPRSGHFGLYSYCVSTKSDFEFYCQGTWTDFGTILNAPFAVATFFVGFSILLIFGCLGLFMMSLFLRVRYVYFICAVIQITCAMCLFIALIVYPSGFADPIIRSVCGQNANDFIIDTCHIRWAYILAIIAFCNILILALLAFLLGLKRPNIDTKRKKILQTNCMSKYGELNEAFDERTYSGQII